MSTSTPSFAAAARDDFAVVAAVRQSGKAGADLSITPGEFRFVVALQLSDPRDPIAFEAPLKYLSDPPDAGHRQIRKKGNRLSPSDHRKAVWFVEARRQLCKKFVVAETDRHGNAVFRPDIVGKPGKSCCRARTVQPFCS